MSDTATPLTCYIHVAQVGRWEAIAHELIERVDAAGLLTNLHELTICWSGSRDAPEWFHRYGKVIRHGNVIPAGEVPTLRHLHAECVANPTGHVLYVHVKGASHPPGPTDRWRDFLSAGVIGRWRECVAKLDEGYDAAGSEWYGWDRAEEWARVWGLRGLDFLPHFAGNWFWARADYVARLEPGPFTTRWDAEYRFIGTGNPRVWCPAFEGKNWYTTG